MRRPIGSPCDGGGALAATGFIGSDGQIHGCVGKSGQLTVLKPGKRCGRGKRGIAWNQRGPRGIQGPRGVQGIPRPGAISFDKQFAYDPGGTGLVPENLASGFVISASCASDAGGQASVQIQAGGANGLYAWGTKAEDGVLAHASANASTGTISATGANSAELDVVGESTPAGGPTQATRFALIVIRGGKCNFHAMVTPSSASRG